MEPNRNRKLTILAVILFLLSAGLVCFLGLKYRAELAKQKEAEQIRKLIPRISAFGSPSTKVGEEYRKEIIASLGETHADLEITVDGLPEGLALTECSQQFDSPILNSPNTLKKCFITGTPTTVGSYPLIIIAIADKSQSAQKTIEISVEKP